VSLQGFYESAWQQPNLLGALGLLLGGAAAWAASRRRPTDLRQAFLARWTQLFALEALLDCVLTGYSSPLGQNTPAMTVAAVVFVIVGDLRLYLLLARLSRPHWSAVALVEALAASLAPSLVIAALKRLAFSPEFGVDYAETATILLQVVATIVGCEGWDDARWAEVFRQECARARLFDHAEQIREASGPGEA
jgi:hypothetical protein